MNIVYLMIDSINNLKYIGSKKNWKSEGSYYGSPSSENIDNPKYELQLLYKNTVKYNPDKIILKILEKVDDETQLLQIEKNYQKKYNAIRSMEFINAAYAGYGFGGTHSDESRKLMSKSHKNHINNNPKRRTHLSNIAKGTVNAINLHTGKIENILVELIDNINYETYLKGERHHMYGKTHTEEAKQKIREANYNYNWTDEHREAHRNSLKGRIFSDEHKQRLKDANTGKNNPNYMQIPWNRKITINGITENGRFWRNFYNISKQNQLLAYLINNGIQYE